jgi:hypothetical protein
MEVHAWPLAAVNIYGFHKRSKTVNIGFAVKADVVRRTCIFVSALERVLNDESLQSGDIVSTNKGLFVFRGNPDHERRDTVLIAVTPRCAICVIAENVPRAERKIGLKQ